MYMHITPDAWGIFGEESEGERETRADTSSAVMRERGSRSRQRARRLKSGCSSVSPCTSGSV